VTEFLVGDGVDVLSVDVNSGRETFAMPLMLEWREQGDRLFDAVTGSIWVELVVTR
jgi:hypothetical protein